MRPLSQARKEESCRAVALVRLEPFLLYRSTVRSVHASKAELPAHMQLSATYRAMGEKEKSLAELKEVSRIKQTQRGTVPALLPLAPSMEGLLSSGQLPH